MSGTGTRRCGRLAFQQREQHHQGQEPHDCPQRPFGRCADHRPLSPAVVETLGVAIVATSEAQQLPLRTGETALCGDTTEAMNYLLVMRSSIPEPLTAIGGDVLHQAFARYPRLWRVQCGVCSSDIPHGVAERD